MLLASYNNSLKCSTAHIKDKNWIVTVLTDVIEPTNGKRSVDTDLISEFDIYT